MKNDLLHEYLVFNDWVDGIIDEIANNESVSLLEFHLTFNHIETMREQANEAFIKANQCFDDENF